MWKSAAEERINNQSCKVLGCSHSFLYILQRIMLDHSLTSWIYDALVRLAGEEPQGRLNQLVPPNFPHWSNRLHCPYTTKRNFLGSKLVRVADLRCYALWPCFLWLCEAISKHKPGIKLCGLYIESEQIGREEPSYCQSACSWLLLIKVVHANSGLS